MLEINGTFIFVFVSFLIFIQLMNLICYKPITKIINEREKLYIKNKKTVEQTNAKKSEVEAAVMKEIQSAKTESSKMLKNALEAGKLKSREVLTAQKADIKSSFERFEADLAKSAQNAKQELKSEIEIHVKNTVSKILEINPADVNVDKSKIDEILK